MSAAHVTDAGGGAVPATSNASVLSEFDAVVMLTWSDWHNEPRSNRFHYATRFARHRPVYFVQPDAKDGKVSFEPVDAFDITIVHVPADCDSASARSLGQALLARGVRRPLLWIYNVFFEPFIRRSGARLKVYHATEDYLSKPEGWAAGEDSVRRPLLDILQQIDLLVAVSRCCSRALAGRSRQVAKGFDVSCRLLLRSGDCTC